MQQKKIFRGHIKGRQAQNKEGIEDYVQYFHNERITTVAKIDRLI